MRVAPSSVLSSSWHRFVDHDWAIISILKAADVSLSTVSRRICLFHGDCSGGQRRSDWLWWTPLLCISAEEGQAASGIEHVIDHDHPSGDLPKRSAVLR